MSRIVEEVLDLMMVTLVFLPVLAYVFDFATFNIAVLLELSVIGHGVLVQNRWRRHD